MLYSRPVAEEPIADIADRLRRFLIFIRPHLIAEAGLDRGNLKRLRNMTDLRLQDFAARQPVISLVQLAELMTYTAGAPSFPELAQETGLLTLEQIALPLPHDAPEVGVAINAILLQNAFVEDKLRDHLAACVKKLAEAPPPPKPDAAAEAPSAVRLPPKVEKLLGHVKGLWGIPPNVMKLRRMLADTNSDVADVAREIEFDPGLVAQVLRVVNSAQYRGDEPTAAIEPAVTRLGFKLMQRIVMVSSLVDQLGKKQEEAEMDLKAYWGHSLWVAHAAQIVCRRRELGDPDEFFSAGLLHDIGKLVIYQYLSAQLKLITTGVRNGAPWEVVEPRVLDGLNHAAIGACVAEQWQFPEVVVEAVRHHLDEIALIESFEMPAGSKTVGVLCAMHASRAPLESVARHFRMGRDTLDGIRKEAFEASVASLRELFEMM